MNSLWIALGFLSRFPSKKADFNTRYAARSVLWFPAVGILLGVAVILVAQVSMNGLGNAVAALIALVAWVWFTGALHLDGLADTFDGFSASGAGKLRALEAMKDSRIGAHGACALGLMLLAKWVVLMRCIEIAVLSPSIIAATMMARVGVGFLLTWVKPAVPTGLGALFARELSSTSGRWIPWLGGLWLWAVVPCVWWITGVGWQCGIQALGLSLIVASGALFLLARRCKACFGGVTGDTHGAAIELTELLVLTVHAAVFGVQRA